MPWNTGTPVCDGENYNGFLEQRQAKFPRNFRETLLQKPEFVCIDCMDWKPANAFLSCKIFRTRSFPLPAMQPAKGDVRMKQEPNNEQQRLAQMAVDLSEIFGVTEPIHTFLEAVDRLNAILHTDAFDQLAQQAFHDPQYRERSIEDLMQENGQTGISFEQFFIQSLRQAKAKQKEQEKMDAVDAKDALPRLQGLHTASHTSPNNRLANMLPKGLAETCQENGPINLIVANRGKSNQITARTMISYKAVDGLTLKGEVYTAYDREVHDAIVSIYLECKKQGINPILLTPAMVYRAMIGKSEQETPSLKSINSILYSIEKMRCGIHVYVDASDELKKRDIRMNGKPVTKFTIDNFMLSMQSINVATGGEEVRGYVITAEPILYTYAKLTGQLLTLPTSLLDIKEVTEEGIATSVSVANTDGRIVIKSYLWRRIAVMKHDLQNKHLKQRHVITFESIFEESGISKADAKTDARKYVWKVLDYWKAAHFIQDYQKRMKGRTADAIELLF